MFFLFGHILALGSNNNIQVRFFRNSESTMSRSMAHFVARVCKTSENETFLRKNLIDCSSLNIQYFWKRFSSFWRPLLCQQWRARFFLTVNFLGRRRVSTKKGSCFYYFWCFFLILYRPRQKSEAFFIARSGMTLTSTLV